MKHKYRLRYELNVTNGEYAKEDAKGEGLTDSLIVISMLYPNDGSFSMAHYSVDGKTAKPVNVNELWKVWSMLSSELSENDSLNPEKRSIARNVLSETRLMLGIDETDFRQIKGDINGKTR